MPLNLLFRHGLAKCWGETCGDDKSSVNEAVKLQGPYVMPDCVIGKSSREIMTLNKLGVAGQDVATRKVQMVAFYHGPSEIFGFTTVCSSWTDIVFMMLVFSGNTGTDPLNFCKQTASARGYLL